MSVTSKFHYAGPGGPISTTALGGFVERLPGNGVNICLGRLDGYVLGCDSVETKNGSSGAVLCVTGLTAVIGREVIIEANLECPIAPGVNDVFLVASAKAEPLDPGLPAGLQARTVSGVLTTSPDASPKILLAKCQWTHALGKIDSPLEASPNRAWWPRILRVADHPFSKAAAVDLRRLLGEVSAPMGFILAAAERGEEIGWTALIRDVLTVATGRFRDRPDHTTELGLLAEVEDQADLVARLIRLLRADRIGSLPGTLDIEEKRFRILEILRDSRPSQHFDGTGSVVKLDCGLSSTDGWLVVAVDGPAGSLYRVTAEVDGMHHRAIRVAGQGAEPLVSLRKGAKVQVCIRSETNVPTLIQAGLYVAKSDGPVNCSAS
jgi:hypothetical protein